MKTIKLYQISNYKLCNSDFINNNFHSFTNKKNLTDSLSSDNYLHFRVHNDSQYIFFGDLDGFNDIHSFISLLIDFLKINYDLELSSNDVSYSKNNTKPFSYHYSIPRWNLSTKNLKLLHNNFISFINDDNLKKSIDTSIYSEHWFRLPNQSKGNLNSNDGVHLIINGDILDFVVELIPDFSIDINSHLDTYFLSLLSSSSNSLIINTTNNNNNVLSFNNNNNNNNTSFIDSQKLTSYLSDFDLYTKLFDECYLQKRFDVYQYWRNIGMSIFNIYGNSDNGIKLFDYFSSKGNNYDGFDIDKKKYLSFRKVDPGFTSATLYHYAKEDNKRRFIEILSKNTTLELGQSDISTYIKLLAGNRFIYLTHKCDDQHIYKLYCFTGKFWSTDHSLLHHFISHDLHDFLKFILTEVYWNTSNYMHLKRDLDKIKKLSEKRDIVETYKEDGVVHDVSMDNNWWLLGFNNIVYDFHSHSFRDYSYDDYISTTTGYNWRNPTSDELTTVSSLISLIFPDPDIRSLYLQILSSSLIGRCIENFIIANGSGGNGKGVLNDLIIAALGNHALIASNSILSEPMKTGANPQLAAIHKKRLVIFREPPADKKFQNATIKELTGGGRFSARTLHEKSTEKELNHTMIVECNTKPLLAENPKEAELRRIIDIPFNSTFTLNDDLLDPDNHIYKANPLFKDFEWQQQHKFALLYILFDYYKSYSNNHFSFNIPQSIKDRTNDYLKSSDEIFNWFNDHYEFTDNKKNIIKLKDIFQLFKSSEFYDNLTKAKRREFNYSNFIDKLKSNLFLKKFIIFKSDNTYIITNYIIKTSFIIS